MTTKDRRKIRLALTGFMGVGKSSVARHLCQALRCRRIDLDAYIEQSEKRKIAEIIDADGIERFRAIETECLRRVLEESDAAILSLGGGTFTVPANREMLKASNYMTVWLESTFHHCWMNISFSKKDRPLARDKATAKRIFDERQKVYCLADWHFIVKPGTTSIDVARHIADEVLS